MSPSSLVHRSYSGFRWSAHPAPGSHLRSTRKTALGRCMWLPPGRRAGEDVRRVRASHGLVERREDAPDFRRYSLSGQSSRRGYSSADAVAEASHESCVVWSLLTRWPLGQLSLFGLHPLTRVWLSHPSMASGRFPKAPGSRSRIYGLRIGPSGRRTAGRSTFPPSEMDTGACGASASTRSPHRPVGEPFAAWHFHGRASYSHGGEDGWSAAAGRIVYRAQRGYRQHLADVTPRHALTFTAASGKSSKPRESRSRLDLLLLLLISRSRNVGRDRIDVRLIRGPPRCRQPVCRISSGVNLKNGRDRRLAPKTTPASSCA